MKTYNQYSSNYLINTFKYINHKLIIDELVDDLEYLKYVLPRSSIVVEPEVLNLSAPISENGYFY